jgi:hypothetical protein
MLTTRMNYVLAAAALSTATLSGCVDSDGPTGPQAPAAAPAPTQLLMVDGDLQHGIEGLPVQRPLQVRALDAQNRPVAGVPVSLRVLSGGGTVPEQIWTDRTGIASTGDWILGSPSERQLVSAEAGRLHVVFSATSHPEVEPASIDGRWYDLEARLHIYDNAWFPNIDGAVYTAVVSFSRRAPDAPGYVARIETWRGIFPGEEFSLPDALGTARFDAYGHLIIEARQQWYLRGVPQESGEIIGYWGCCGTFAGAFTLTPRTAK